MIEDAKNPAKLENTELEKTAKREDTAAEQADRPGDQTKAEGRGWLTARTVLASVTAVLVVGLGATLVPAAPRTPAPSFSEVARTSALADARALQSDAKRVAAATAAADMLDLQARALRRPDDVDAMPSPATRTASGSASPTPSASNSSTVKAPTTAELVTRLAASGSRRIADATASDGGTARLLAAVGTAQLLEAKKLAASAGLPVPSFPATTAATGARGQEDSAPPATGSSSGQASGGPPGSGSAGGYRSTDDPRAAVSTSPAGADPARANPAGAGQVAAGQAGADTAGALTAVGRGEAEAVYLYQVALTRLDPATGRTAAGLLAVHEANVRQAEELSRLNCITLPPREAGYRLPDSLAAQPAAALGSVEAGMLGVYGDLIALGTAEARNWAVHELAAAAQRASAWGVDPGFLPGVSVQASELPAS